MKKQILILILTCALITLKAQVQVDNTFNSGGGGASFPINCVAVQSDGKIIIGGRFLQFNTSVTGRIARLNPDGTVDNTFLVGSGASEEIYSIVIQPDGKILVGGDFISFNNVPANRIVRLNKDGTIDNTFNIGTGPSHAVKTIAVQTNGKIILGGSFVTFNGVVSGKIVRLNSNGSVDDTFNPEGGGFDASGEVLAIAIQTGGEIIVGGSFVQYNTKDGQNKLNGANRIIRLTVNGGIDESFNSGCTQCGASHEIRALKIQPDGKIIAGGVFVQFNSSPVGYVVRLNANGSVDTDFNSGCTQCGASGIVNTILLEPNGDIILGGDFGQFNSSPVGRIIRLNSGGSIDINFVSNSGASGAIKGIAKHINGGLIVVGDLNQYNTSAVGKIARVTILEKEIIYSNNFSGGSAGWSYSGSSGFFDQFTVNSVYNCTNPVPNIGGGNYLHVAGDEQCAYAWYGSGTGGTLYASMTSDIINDGHQSLSVAFNWLCVGSNNAFKTYGAVEYSTNSGATWAQMKSPRYYYNDQSSWVKTVITSADVPGLLVDGKFRLRFAWVSSGFGQNPAFSIDNLVISGTKEVYGNCVAPPGVKATNITPASALISWNAEAVVYRYQLRYRPKDSLVWKTFNVTPGLNQKSIKELTQHTEYEFQVRANCGGTVPLYTKWSSLSFFTTGFACVPPESVTVSNLKSTEAKINWNTVVPAYSYELRYRPSGTFTWKKKTVSAPTVSKKLTDLISNTEYEYQVRTICDVSGKPASAWSDVQTFNTHLRMEEVTSFIENSLMIFPNPSNGSFTVKMQSPSSGNGTIQVQNMLGQLVYSKEVGVTEGENTFTISFNNVAGLYNLVIKTPEVNLIRKISVDK